MYRFVNRRVTLEESDASLMGFKKITLCCGRWMSRERSKLSPERSLNCYGSRVVRPESRYE